MSDYLRAAVEWYEEQSVFVRTALVFAALVLFLALIVL